MPTNKAGKSGYIKVPAAAFAAMAVIAAVGAVVGLLAWPRTDPDLLAHEHVDHPHLVKEHGNAQEGHVFTIDTLHHRWPGAR